jgi:hypothetical protein
MPIDQPYRRAVGIRTFVFPLTKVGKSWLCIALVFPTRRQSYSVCIVGNWETGFEEMSQLRHPTAQHFLEADFWGATQNVTFRTGALIRQ